MVIVGIMTRGKEMNSWEIFRAWAEFSGGKSSLWKIDLDRVRKQQEMKLKWELATVDQSGTNPLPSCLMFTSIPAGGDDCMS